MQSDTPLDGANGRSEDCLYLDIVSPNNVAGTDAKLPVMVWIYGGGFSNGASALYTTLGAPTFVKRATKTGKPVIVVNINYRMGVWGFPMGPDMAGSANYGLRVQ
jgi:carboxylesterase type B